MRNKIINAERSEAGVTFFDYANGDSGMIAYVERGFLCEYADGSGWVMEHLTVTKRSWIAAWWYLRKTASSFSPSWD